MSFKQSLCAKVDQNLGFDFGAIFDLLIPALRNLPCFTGERETPQQFLAKRYNERTGEYRRVVYRQCREETRKAAIEAGHTDLSVRQLDHMTKLTLDEIRQNPEAR